MRLLRETVPLGLALLALTPLISAVRSVVTQEWVSYGLYVAAGLGLLVAAWAWHKGHLVGVRLGLTVSAAGLLVRLALTLGGGPANAYLLTFAVWALGASAGAVWSWRHTRAGAAVVVAVTGAAFLAYLALDVRDGLHAPMVVAGLLLGVVGALVAARGLTARAE